MADRRPTEGSPADDPATDEAPAGSTGIAVTDVAQGENGGSTSPVGSPAIEGQQAARPTARASTAPKATVAGRVWVAIGVAVVVLVLLIIFIAENSRDVTVSFLGAHGTLSLGLAMLIAALAGVAITLLVGTARILQLRREVRRHRRRARTAH